MSVAADALWRTLRLGASVFSLCPQTAFQGAGLIAECWAADCTGACCGRAVVRTAATRPAVSARLPRRAQMVDKKKSRSKEVVTREYTINLHKRLHNTSFKKKAPRAVKEVRKFAQKMMKTQDVRLDVKLNKEIWHKARPRPLCARRLPALGACTTVCGGVQSREPASDRRALLQGIRNVPFRLRIRIERRRNDDEDAKVSSSHA